MFPSIVLLAFVATATSAFDHTHTRWTRVLQTHSVEAAGPSTNVRYAALKASPAELDAIISQQSEYARCLAQRGW